MQLEFEVQGGIPSTGGRADSTHRGSGKSGEAVCLGSREAPSLATWCRAVKCRHGGQLGGMLSIRQDQEHCIHSLAALVCERGVVITLVRGNCD